jgi:hypothetical protein
MGYWGRERSLAGPNFEKARILVTGLAGVKEENADGAAKSLISRDSGLAASVFSMPASLQGQDRAGCSPRLGYPWTGDSAMRPPVATTNAPVSNRERR